MTPKRFNAVSATKLATPVVELPLSNSPTPLPLPDAVPMELTTPVVPEKPKSKWRKRPAGTPRDSRPRSAKQSTEGEQTQRKSYHQEEESEISDEDSRVKSPVKEYTRAPGKVVEIEIKTPKSNKKKKVQYIPVPSLSTPFPPPTTTTTTTTMVGIPISVGAKSSTSAAGARRSGRAAIPSRQAKESLATKRKDGKIAARRAAEAAALLAGEPTTTNTIEPAAAILEVIRVVEPTVEKMVLDETTVEVVQASGEVMEEGQEYGMFGKITRWFGWRP